jgi:hypothetical protein
MAALMDAGQGRHPGMVCFNCNGSTALAWLDRM